MKAFIPLTKDQWVFCLILYKNVTYVTFLEYSFYLNKGRKLVPFCGAFTSK